jgi:hypothetical protein
MIQIENPRCKRGCSFGSLLLILLVFVAASSALFGQASSGTGSISGLATDPSGAVVPDADVVVRNVETNITRTLKTNEAGLYEAVALQPGSYEVKISKNGFATLSRTGITLSVGQRAVVDLRMQISATTETVTVDANVALVETDKTDVSTVVNMKDVMNLPMNGRRWDSFAMTTPGASNDGGFGLISFRGMSGLYNNNMVDGMDNNQAFFSEAKGRTRLAYGISTEAIQEFQVGTSSFSAQYGRAAGGVVNAVTRSGSNDLHGSFFYLIRDESLNAANPVGGPQLIRSGLAPKPKDRRQQFGPSVGGAIKRDKLFYFLSYDQQKRTFPAVVIPGSSAFLTSSCTAPGCSNVVAFYQGMIGPQNRQGNQWVGLSKIDWNLTPRNQISSTVNILRWDSPNGIQTAPTHAVHESQNGSDGVETETIITRWNSMISPTFLSELKFQWGRDFEFQSPNAPGPSVTVTNGINFGMPNFLPRAAYPNEKRWQGSQNLSWLRNRHSFKIGFDLTHVNDKMINLFQGGGTYSFSSLNNFALDCGNPAFPLPLKNCQAATTGLPANTVPGKHYTTFTQAFDSLGQAGATEFSTVDFAAYFEDSFRPVPGLTLNMGLRYEIQTMPTLNGNPDVPATSRLNMDKNNFGPRFGLAWDPFKQQKTVFRVGGGMYYGRTQNSTIVNLITNNGVRFKSYSLSATAAGSPVFPNVFSEIPSGTGARSDVLFAANDFVNPVTYQAEFSIEHELFREFTLSGIYMLNRGQRMPIFIDTNLFPPGSATYTVCASPQSGTSTACSNVERTFTVPFFSGSRPNPNYGFMTSAQSVVNTWYNGAVLQAKKRFSHGFQLQASLTISKAQDNNQTSITFSSTNVPINPMNLRQDYALSDFDQRKRFTMSAVWELPTHNIKSTTVRRLVHGFQLSGILLLADGRPFSPSTTGNPSPNGVFGGLLGDGGSRLPYIGRNTYTLPGANSIDLRIAREIKFSERVRWQLIAEGFNVANRVQVTSIVTTQYGVAGSTLFPRADFRSVSAAGTNLFRERQFQLGTRLTF